MRCSLSLARRRRELRLVQYIGGRGSEDLRCRQRKFGNQTLVRLHPSEPWDKNGNLRLKHRSHRVILV